MRPAFSVIVPIYGNEQFLEQCLRSVKEQSFTSWELILVNDGSPGAALDKWSIGQQPAWRAQVDVAGVPRTEQARAIFDGVAQGDARFRYISQPNGGQGRARNAGLDAATGERLVFLDSDDWFEPDYLARAHAALQNAGRGEVVHGEVRCLINGEAKPFEAIGRVPRPNNLRTMLVYPTWTITAVNYFWRLDDVRHAGIRFVEKRRGEDTLFVWENLLAQARAAGELHFRSTGGVCWYRRFGNQTTTGQSFNRDLFASFERFARERRRDFLALGWRYGALIELLKLRSGLQRRPSESAPPRASGYAAAARGLSALAFALSGGRRW